LFAKEKKLNLKLKTMFKGKKIQITISKYYGYIQFHSETLAKIIFGDIQFQSETPKLAKIYDLLYLSYVSKFTFTFWEK
jgi:hypothetical protein